MPGKKRTKRIRDKDAVVIIRTLLGAIEAMRGAKNPIDKTSLDEFIHYAHNRALQKCLVEEPMVQRTITVPIALVDDLAKFLQTLTD
ncbi:MAG: hypothetical protein ACD_15C00033G0001 [uncultured bacterium]|nr:MAG: hypothetical protein ACD_15C00033G0001 [uncultured bacterium]